MEVVGINYLLEAGVHFGHPKRTWNPKMAKYIFNARDNIYIIDLDKTSACLTEAYVALKEIVQNEGKIIFVGTKKQSKEIVEKLATDTGNYFVNERWLGGTLTNFKTIRQRVKRLDEIEEIEANGTFELLPKKEVIQIRKEYEKLKRNLSGIRDMKNLPDALIVVDIDEEDIAVKEAKKMGIPIFGIVDTNNDPDLVDYPIPGNNDAVKSIEILLGVLNNAILEAQGKPVVDYLIEDEAKKVDFKTAKFSKKSEAEPIKSSKEVNHKIEKETIAKEKPKKEVKKEPVKKSKVETKEEIKEDLENMTVKDLRSLAKEKGVVGFSSLKKDELIKKLKEN